MFSSSLSGVGFHNGRRDDESSHPPEYSLDDLSDVDLGDGLAEGDLLQADDQGVMRPVQPADMAEGWIALDNLSDVTAPSPSNHQLIWFDTGTGEYVPVSPSELAGDIALNDLSDVTITGVASNHIIIRSGSSYVNALLNLDLLSDVVIGVLAAGHTLRYNGTNFVNTFLGTDDILNGSTVSGVTLTQALNNIETRLDGHDTDITNLDNRITDLENNEVDIPEPLRVIAGTISIAASSTKTRGEGFTVSGGTAGTTITFSSPFTVRPTIIVKLFGDGGTTLTAEAYAENPTASGFDVRIITTGGANATGTVDFIVMGTPSP